MLREWHCLKRLGVASLEKVGHWGCALRFQKSKSGPVTLFLLPVNADVELSATCLSAPVFPAMMIMNETSETISQP